MFLIFFLHSVHRVEHIHVVRLGAVFSSPHVAVESSKTGRAGTAALFAKQSGSTSPYLSLVHDAPLDRQHRRLSTKDQTAPEGLRLMCWPLRPTTEISSVLANGYIRVFACLCVERASLNSALFVALYFKFIPQRFGIAFCRHGLGPSQHLRRVKENTREQQSEISDLAS